jgi:DNA mismatch repair protein MutS
MTKNIVKERVTELDSGVSMNDEVLQSKQIILASVFNKSIGISFFRCFHREFLTAQGNAEYIDKLLQNFSPSEVLIQKK